jgi:hypothetical protein
MVFLTGKEEHAIPKPQWLGAETGAARVCYSEREADSGISAQPIVLVDQPEG